MSVTVALAVAFLLVMGLTLLFPGLPPAQLLFEYLKIPQTTLSIWGISIATLLNSITNGFFWVMIAAIAYGLASHTRKREPLPPMPVMPHLPTPPPKPILVDSRVNKIPPALTVTVPSITVRREPARIEPGIETIEGIGPVCGGLLRNLGICTVSDLLKAGAKERGRRYLASEIGVTYATLLRWVHRGDLLRVRGIGRKYATLLESAGVGTVTDLSMRNPRYLSRTLKAVNRERSLVRRIPPSETIEIWVSNARKLKPIVE